MAFLSHRQTTSVVVVEPSASVRQMIADVLREANFQSIETLSSGKDLIHFLEVERVDWIIMPTLLDSKTNVFHLLKVITTYTELFNTYVSLFVDLASEAKYIPSFFEHGILSIHEKTYVKESVKEDFNDFFIKVKEENNCPLRIAAGYLREFLTYRKKYKSRICLEENLMHFFPGNAKTLLHASEAYLLNDEIPKGASLLNQALLIDEKLKPDCKIIADKFGVDLHAEGYSDNQVNILGLSKVVIIDPDTDVLSYLNDLLIQAGVKKVERFDNYQHALDYLKTSKHPDLILCEWHQFNLTNGTIVQRIRAENITKPPIIIISSLVEQEDVFLLEEMDVVAVIKKPLQKNNLFSALVKVVDEMHHPREGQSILNKVRRLLKTNNIDEASRLASVVFSDKNAQDTIKCELMAEISYFKDNYTQACKYGLKSISLGNDSLNILNLVGKAFLKLKRYSNAIDCFNKANEKCHLNYERMENLFHAGEVLHDLEIMKNSSENMAKIDPNNLKTLENLAKMNLIEGKKTELQNTLPPEAINRIISYTNNYAISLIQNKEFEKGIYLYRKALASIAKDDYLNMIRILYNLALAYARYGDYSEAIEILGKMQIDVKNPIGLKIKSLLQKVKSAKSYNTKIDFNSNEEMENGPYDAAPSVNVNKEKELDGIDISDVVIDNSIAPVALRRGEYCCFQIFYHVESLEEVRNEIKTICENTPEFVLRKAIIRS